jgi:DNA-binding XRE family transcriptional regulator
LKAAELKDIRLRKLELTQEQMAKKLDVHRHTIRRYERSRRNVPRWLEYATRYLVGR